MRAFRFAILVAAVFSGSNVVDAEDEAPVPAKRWVEYYTGIAKSYDIRLKSAPDEPLRVSDARVFSFANPLSGRDSHGAIFVWTRSGRAEVVAAIWSFKGSSDRRVMDECQSLATEPLFAKEKGTVVWTPDRPGIELKPIPGAPVPARTLPLRLAQMREISRQFTAFDSPIESGVVRERTLRLVPTPMYRYSGDDKQDDKQDESDGAIFGYWGDWNPEIILVIEIRRTTEGPRWHFGAGCMDSDPLRLEHHGVEVWKKPSRGDLGGRSEPYYARIARTVPLTPP